MENELRNMQLELIDILDKIADLQAQSCQLKRELIRKAIEEGRDDLFSLDMRAVRTHL